MGSKKTHCFILIIGDKQLGTDYLNTLIDVNLLLHVPYDHVLDVIL